MPKTNTIPKQANREFVIYMGKIFGMWFVGAFYWLAAVVVCDYFHGYVDSSSLMEWFIFAALWLPLKWTKHMPQELIKESWADKNAIHS